MTRYKILKTITNNIVRATDSDNQEMILIGKGIGFGKKKNDILVSNNVEDIFCLVDKEEQKLYTQLLAEMPLRIMDISSEIITYIQSKISAPLNEHIHIALTDHIASIVKRCQLGLQVDNPFLHETNSLYPKEAEIAETVVQRLEKELSIKIPKGEVGFITLHIVTAVSNESMRGIQKKAELLVLLKEVIEDQLELTINESDLAYVRLITHVRFMLERIERNESIRMPDELEVIIIEKYPEYYNLAWKLVKIVQKSLAITVEKTETVYIALHLYRFAEKNDV
ncbi:PRD domain-containing protein [Enterococcus sp. AZ196]|uniref:PRD domain-containing protein n=1 Tax=Enterococcus sp. AZ196 TaxID=2774659 RepID=UPI003D273D19